MLFNKNVEARLGLRFFFGGKPGTPPPVPAPPSPTDAAQSVNNQMQAKKRKGYSSTFLSGPGGVQEQPTVKTLLGG